MTTIVIMPGGFHPFHAGHLALYDSAREAFPGAEVFVAATNDTSARPFPFAVKEKLAKLAGVAAGHFVQVRSPFRAEEITSKFDPARDRLIFVRSEKDANKPPQAGGVKKDGSAAYLQPLAGQTNIRPFKEHAYMAYLPTVEFGPGMTSATEIRTAWPTLNEKRKTALVMSLYPRTQSNLKLANTVVKLLDAAIGTQDMAEAVAPSQYAKLYHSTPLHSLDAILQSGYLAPTGNPAYLSLTRDSKLDYGSWAGSDSFVEFDVDQNAVRQRIKLEPYNHSATMGGPRATGGGESEERTRQKIPLKGFVTAMHAPTGWEGDKAGEHYGNLLKKYGVPIVYDIVPTLEEQGVEEGWKEKVGAAALASGMALGGLSHMGNTTATNWDQLPQQMSTQQDTGGSEKIMSVTGPNNKGEYRVRVTTDNDVQEFITKTPPRSLNEFAPGDEGVAENFADGRNPQDKGDAKRHGINTKASVSSLRKTAKQGGRKGQLAHWLANMKAGRAKKKAMSEGSDPNMWQIPLRIGKYLDPYSAEFENADDYLDSTDLIDDVEELIDAGVEPRIVTVNPEQLFATQDWLSNYGSDGALFDDYSNLPVVYKKANELYILDGHHRTSAALKKHTPIKVYLFEPKSVTEDYLDESR